MANLIKKSIQKHTQLIATLLDFDAKGVRLTHIDKEYVDGGISVFVVMVGTTNNGLHTRVNVNLNPNANEWCINDSDTKDRFNVTQNHERLTIADTDKKNQLNQSMRQLGLIMQLSYAEETVQLNLVN